MESESAKEREKLEYKVLQNSFTILGYRFDLDDEEQERKHSHMKAMRKFN